MTDSNNEPSQSEMNQPPQLSILVVDDEQDVCYLLCSYLTSKGHIVRYSTTIEGAVPMIRSNDHDVIFLDINLQDGNGLTLLKEKVIPEKAKTIVMSAMRDKAGEALELGAAQFIAKPFSVNSVVDTIQDLRSST